MQKTQKNEPLTGVWTANPAFLGEGDEFLNEQKERRGTGPFLRAGALILALVLLWQLVVPSLTNAARADTETEPVPTENPALLADDGSRPDTAQGYSDLADQSIAGEDYDTALIRLEAARALLEGQQTLTREDEALLENLWLKTATVSILNGDLITGRQALDQVLTLDPGDEDALLLRAQLNVEGGTYQQAVRDVEAYLEGNPKDAETRRTLAQLLEQMEDYAGAMAQYETLYSQFPEDESANLNALRCLFLLGRYQEAADGFQDYLLRLPEEGPDPYGGVADFLLAASLLQLGRMQEAAAGFEKAMEVGYDKASCLEQLSLCRFDTGEYDKVIQAGEELLALEDGVISSPALLLQRMGVSAVYLGDYEKALGYMDRSQVTGESPEGTAYYRGICLMSLQRTREAVEAFTQSIEEGYLLQFSHYNRGVCYVTLEEYPAAREDMEKTLQTGDDPDLTAAAEDIRKQIDGYYDQLKALETTGEAVK